MSAEKPPGRPMKFPYTFSAKIAQFPFKMLCKQNWIIRYYLPTCLLALPIFLSIQRLSNSPGNVQKWEEKARAEAMAHHH